MSEAETGSPPHGNRGNCEPSKGYSPRRPLINPDAAPRPGFFLPPFALSVEQQLSSVVADGGSGGASAWQQLLVCGWAVRLLPASWRGESSCTGAIMRMP